MYPTIRMHMNLMEYVCCAKQYSSTKATMFEAVKTPMKIVVIKNESISNKTSLHV